MISNCIQINDYILNTVKNAMKIENIEMITTKNLEILELGELIGH